MQTIASLAGWFDRSLAGILQQHGVSAARTTRRYLAGLLAGFARSETLVTDAAGRAVHRTLAVQWAEAHAEQTPAARSRRLRGRGDLALFMCGVFPGYVSTRTSGHDYYLAMGCSAYTELADMTQGEAADTWSELAAGFADFAEALNVTVWGQGLACDPLSLYERWVAGRGELTRRRLAALNIDPVPLQSHVRH